MPLLPECQAKKRSTRLVESCFPHERLKGLPDSVKLVKGAARIAGLTAVSEGVIRVAGRYGCLAAVSNPVSVTTAPALGRYWADLHAQSEETIGTGTVEEYLAFARDYAFLDAIGHQGNDFQITRAFWKRLNAATRRFTREGRFLAFPGYEWSGNTHVGGDRSVVANSDGHKDRPGASHPGSGHLSNYGGLTCILAPRLTRRAVFDAIRARHTYATTGARIGLEVRFMSNGKTQGMMGDAVRSVRFEAINFHRPDNQPRRVSQQEISWNGRTAGGVQGLILHLNKLTGKIAFKTGRKSPGTGYRQIKQAAERLLSRRSGRPGGSLSDLHGGCADRLHGGVAIEGAGTRSPVYG